MITDMSDAPTSSVGAPILQPEAQILVPRFVMELERMRDHGGGTAAGNGVFEEAMGEIRAANNPEIRGVWLVPDFTGV